MDHKISMDDRDKTYDMIYYKIPNEVYDHIDELFSYHTLNEILGKIRDPLRTHTTGIILLVHSSMLSITSVSVS